MYICVLTIYIAVPPDLVESILLPLPIMSFTIQGGEKGGASPLFSASGHGHTEVVETLLKSEADPNQTTTV